MASVLKVDTIQHTDGTSPVAAKVNESRQCVMGFMLTSGVSGSATLTGWTDMATQLSGENVGKITRGGSVTESSGVFTLPFTGLWQVELYASANSSGGDPTVDYNIQSSQNGGGTFSSIAQAKESHSASTYKLQISLKTFYKCTNTTNDVIRFATGSAANTTTESATEHAVTSCIFTWLGDAD
jgi:hypothetical protein